jgi:uncharacterized protein (TIGR03437 family)
MRNLTFTLFLCALCASAQTQPKYTIQDLGALPGMPYCMATAISQSGIIAGHCSDKTGGVTAGGTTHAFLYSAGVMKDLGPAPRSVVIPLAVNDSGVMIGTYFQIVGIAARLIGPVLYQDGAYQQTGFVQEFPATDRPFVPISITNSGQVCGTVVDLTLNFNEIVGAAGYLVPVAGGSKMLLPTPAGRPYAGAFGLSTDGRWAAGGATNVNIHIAPNLWHDGVVQPLSSLSGYQSQFAISVNDKGDATGPAFNMSNVLDYDPDAVAHGVLFSGNTATDIGVLPGDRASLPRSINNSGQIIGFDTSAAPSGNLEFEAMVMPPTNQTRSFVYADGKLYDLVKQVDNGSGWVLSYAAGQNNAGQIVGTGLHDGVWRAYLLTPVQPPTITSVAGAGLSVPAVASVSPNGLISLFGSGFADAGVSHVLKQSDIVNSALPTNLANVCVQGGADRWGLTYVSATQVNALAGVLPASGSVPVTVIEGCGTANEHVSAAFNVTAAAATPEFLYFVQNANGQNPVAAIQARTGAYVGPVGLLPGATFTPAQANDVLTVFAVGLGATDPPTVIGTLAAGTPQLTSTYTLTIGNVPAHVLYAGLTPTFAGLYQINFVVPSGVAAGNQPIALAINGVPAPTGAYLAIRE